MRAAIVLLMVTCSAFGQRQTDLYTEAFRELRGMLTDSMPLSFKRAVFLTENAYSSNQYSYQAFDENIKVLSSLSRNISAQNPIIYDESDKEVVNKYAAVFRLMTDGVRFRLDSSNYFVTEPYVYDFDDFWGEKRWEKMFVTKLLTTHSGNCHSLPFLYKILCEELGEKAYLAMAPNHIYIKQRCKKTGWYNTELTTGHFPIDAWIMASGYVHLSAVRNRIFMDTLSEKQSIAVCLLDLANGYKRKLNDFSDLDFILKCCDLALLHYPNYVDALLLKVETKKRRFEQMMSHYGAEYPSDIFGIKEAKNLFDEMQNYYLHIHELGYRKMPKEMYLKWLADLGEEREKYLNKDIQNINSKN